VVVQTQQHWSGVIGTRFRKIDAAGRVTGATLYADDLPMRDSLYGKILRSPHAHARIKRIDYSRALKLPGVKAVVTGADFPDVPKNASVPIGEFEMGVYHLSKLMMARDKALFYGHAVAAVAATDPHIAEEALGLIDVDYEVLPPVLDPVLAMEPGALVLDEELFTRRMGVPAPAKPSNVAVHAEWVRGDVEAAFKTADAIVERTFKTQVKHPGYIEPDANTASFHPDGTVEVWPNTRGIFFHKNQLAILLGIPAKRIIVHPVEMGGAFGGKMHAIVSPLCVRLSERSGRPVRIVLGRDEVLMSEPPGPQAVITFKIGANKDGRIAAIQGRLIYDAGAFPGASVMAGMLVGVAPYRTPNLRMDGFDVVTNKPRVGSLRAPGGPDACFAVESVIDDVAQAIGMDPLEFRLKNCVQTGDPQPNNIPVVRIGLKDVLERAQGHPAWTDPLPGKSRGRGVAIGYWGGGVNTSSCHLTVGGDGAVSLTIGAIEMSTTRTGFLQMCADSLELPPEEIRIAMGDTETAGYSDITGGSRMTYSMSSAIVLACQDLLGQMKRRAEAMLGAAEGSVDYRAGVFFVKDAPDKKLGFKQVAQLATKAGGALIAHGSNPRMKPAPGFALHIADVEVDEETGKVTVLRYTAFQDVGRAINPTLVEGQMQGGAVQGIGWALTEELVWDERGVLLNPSLLDYRMPTAADVPMIDTVIVEVPATDGPFGARGIGELVCVPCGGAIGNAVFHATGVRMTVNPMTPDRVLWALKARKGR